MEGAGGAGAAGRFRSACPSNGLLAGVRVGWPRKQKEPRSWQGEGLLEQVLREKSDNRVGLSPFPGAIDGPTDCISLCPGTIEYRGAF